MFCSEWALVKDEGAKITIMPLRCKCWTCDVCRPIRAARLVWEAKRGKPNLFVTLTSRRTPGGCPHAAARALSHAWRTVRREYIKEHGKGSLAFLVVFEATKSGWPHLHMVARCKWLSQKWLKKRMGELIDSKHVDVRRIRGLSKVAHYVTKYIGKNPHRFIGTKRYWRSLDYLFPSDEEEDIYDGIWNRWEVERFNWLTTIKYYVDEGYILAMGRHEAVLTRCKPP